MHSSSSSFSGNTKTGPENARPNDDNEVKAVKPFAERVDATGKIP
jgi:hypothetical protein